MNRESEKPFFFDSLEQDIEKFIDLLQKHIASEYVVVFLLLLLVFNGDIGYKISLI